MILTQKFIYTQFIPFMANLTEISIGMRKLAVWTAILFVIYLILKMFFGMYMAYYKLTHPIPIPIPNVRFNKLPPPKFISKQSTSGLKFILQNIEGKPPEGTDAAKVYPQPKKLPTLLDDQKARAFGRKLNFTGEPVLLSSTLYRFSDPADPARTLELDITSLNFHLKYDYPRKLEIFKNQEPIQKEQPLTEVTNFLQYSGLFDDSIAKGIIIVSPLQYDDNLKGFKDTSSISSADTLRIDYFRKDIDGMKVLPPLYNRSYNYILYTPSPGVISHILEISYQFWPISFDDFGTYPIKSGTSAWQDLTDGYAWVISMGNNKPDSIVIRNMYLAYYDSEESQDYLQPIFVFEGDNGFIAYLPAVTSDWIQ